jgi:hypothetical protein
MTRELFIGGAAALALSAAAFAQSTGVATTTGTTAGTSTTGCTAVGTISTGTPADICTTTGTATGTGTSPGPVLTGVVGITPPGVAGGVTPYRPAGALASNAPAAVATLVVPTPPSIASLPGAGPSSGSGVAAAISATLQAGEIGPAGPTPIPAGAAP